MSRGFEREVPFLKYVVGAADICLHVGASDGRHTFIMSRLAPRGRIYAFEPAEYSFAVLRNIVALHGLSNTSAFNLAVSDVEEDITLVTPVKMNGQLGRSFATIAQDPAAVVERGDIQTTGDRRQAVRAVVLDRFLAERRVDRADFLRCDVEGAEGKVLQGARGIIDRSLPNMLVELHPVALRTVFGTSAEAVRDWILGRGYRMFHVRGNRLVASEEIIPGPWNDYFFIHPSRAATVSGPFRDAMAA